MRTFKALERFAYLAAALFFHTDTFKMAFDAAVVAYRVIGWAFVPFVAVPTVVTRSFVLCA